MEIRGKAVSAAGWNRFAAGTSGQRIDHYSVLRTLEDMYGLAPLGKAATATPISGIWSAG